ncbi:MAG: hypothetical protein II831_06110 [Firmicutes bacterium]|nr:hypothetical protein [Bacillota bacterium]
MPFGEKLKNRVLCAVRFAVSSGTQTDLGQFRLCETALKQLFAARSAPGNIIRLLTESTAVFQQRLGHIHRS